MITIERVSDKLFNVTVDGEQVTSHTVTIDPAYHRKLTKGRVPVETLVNKSFEFLLERENNTDIFPSFDLAVLRCVFPDYERKLPLLLG
jgi:hypothetical protein